MKKHIFYLMATITVQMAAFFSVNVIAQQSYSDAVQIMSEFDHESDKVIFNANNQDFCDYVVFIGISNDTRFIVVRPGKSELFRVKNSPTVHYTGYHFAMYRGNMNKKPNIDFAYSLPIAKGDSLIMFTNIFSDGYQMDFTFYSDTMYAVRGGIVCNDDLTDFTAKGYQHFHNNPILKKLTIYHNDGTFCEYVFIGQTLIDKGERVKIGQPIAVLRKDNIHYVSLSVYFLDKNKFRNLQIGNKHTHFRPFFQIKNDGKLRLEEDKVYFSELNNEMLMQDMNRREQKKFSKNK